MNDLSRRSFITGAATAGAMTAMGMLSATAFASESTSGSASGSTSASASGSASASAASTSASTDLSWDRETEVLVLGAGGAGMRAAYTAKDAGCDVLVLEKADTFGGTSIRSGGIIQAAGTDAQKKITGITDDTPEAHAELYMLEGEGWVDEDLITDMCEHAPEHIAFLESLGLVFTQMTGVAHTPYADAAGITIPPRIHGTDGGATEIYTTLHDATEALGVEFVYNCEAKKLIQDADGCVIGVEATDESGATIHVKASRGVVIATSGIDHNEEMARQLCYQQYWDLTKGESATAPTNTGDGIRMGMQIGAMVRNFGGTIDLTARTWAGLNSETPNMPAVFVNCYGRRFVCEDCTYAYAARGLYQEIMRTGQECYTVFGSNVLPYQTIMAELSTESLDAEVEAGTAWKGETVEELAAAIGVDPTNLATTIDTWNNDVTNGVDSQLGRLTGLEPIEAPYYAITEGGVFNMGAIGGLAINANAQVLDFDANPIPHLYAAGAASAGWMGPFYPGSGTALLGGQHWGWRAGSNAAAEDKIA